MIQRSWRYVGMVPQDCNTFHQIFFFSVELWRLWLWDFLFSHTLMDTLPIFRHLLKFDYMSLSGVRLRGQVYDQNTVH